MRVLRNIAIGNKGAGSDTGDLSNPIVSLETKLLLKTEELEKLHLFLDSVVNSAYFGIASYEPVTDASGAITDFRILYTNAEVAANFGLTVEDVTGKLCSEVYPGLFENGVFDKMKKAMLTGKSEKYDIKVNTKGKDIWLSAAVENSSDSLTITSKIVTSEKEAEIRLLNMNRLLQNKNKELEQRILTEFSQSFDQFATGKPFFDFLMEELYDKTRLDYMLVGEWNSEEGFTAVNSLSVCDHGMIIQNFDYPLEEGPCREVLKGSFISMPSGCREVYPDNNMLKSLKVDGYMGYPLWDGKGDCIGLISIMHGDPIADTHYVESLLRIAAKRCSMEIDKLRNSALLEQKNTKLELQNKELMSFAHIASHDLQEPLRKIRMFASRILEREGLDFTAETLDSFSRMNQTVHHMQKLVSDLLTYSTIDAGNLSRKKTDFNAIIFDVIEEIKMGSHIEDGVAVQFEIEELPLINAIPAQVSQLFSNILQNAVKFSRPGIPNLIKITHEYVDKGKQFFCRINVSDTGIGFDMKYKERVFEVFQRLHDKMEYAGTGIGLGICKKIMNNHDGYISASSVIGQGAVFSMDFPIKG